jgi:hypothetical protein
MPIDFGATLNTIKNGIIDLGKTAGAKELSQLTAAAQSTADAIKDDVVTWTAQLTSGGINADQLKFLIAGDEEYFHIAALTQAGIALAQMDAFKAGVANLIVKTLSALVP